MTLAPPTTVMWNGGTNYLASSQENSNFSVFKTKENDSPRGISFVLFDITNGKVNILQIAFYCSLCLNNILKLYKAYVYYQPTSSSERGVVLFFHCCGTDIDVHHQQPGSEVEVSRVEAFVTEVELSDTCIDKKTGYAMVANALKLWGKSQSLVVESAKSDTSKIEVSLAVSGETLVSGAAVPVAAAPKQISKSKVVVHPQERQSSNRHALSRIAKESKVEADAARVREIKEAKVAKETAKDRRDRAAAERKLLKEEKSKKPKSKAHKFPKAARPGEFAFFSSSHYLKLTLGAIKKRSR